MKLPKFSKNLSFICTALWLAAIAAGYILVGRGESAAKSSISPSCEAPIVEVVSPAPAGSGTVAGDVQRLCLGWSAVAQYPSIADCVSALSPKLGQSVAAAECGHTMTAAECSDVEHDFADAAGVKHCVGTKQATVFFPVGMAVGSGTKTYVATFGGTFVGDPDPMSWVVCTAKPGATYVGRGCE